MHQRSRIGLKIARENANITEIQLASKLKVDVSVIRAWEIGAGIIQLPVLIELSSILDVSTEMILFSEERKPLDLSYLKEDQREIVIKFYRKVKIYE